MRNLTWIVRNGKRINLTIEKYQGKNTLAFDDAGKPWVRVGRGKWNPAVCTPK